MNKKTFVIAGGSTGVAKQVVSELIKLGHNVVFGDLDVKNELGITTLT
jgi:short-subunit dehydrogenase